jgi:hypothetical protein
MGTFISEGEILVIEAPDANFFSFKLSYSNIIFSEWQFIDVIGDPYPVDFFTGHY